MNTIICRPSSTLNASNVRNEEHALTLNASPEFNLLIRTAEFKQIACSLEKRTILNDRENLRNFKTTDSVKESV